MPRHRQPPPKQPIHKGYNKVGFRVYYEWLDGTDGKYVRCMPVTDEVTTAKAAQEIVKQKVGTFPQFRIIDTEETIVRYGWVGVAGIGYAGHADPPIRFPDWHGVFDHPFSGN